jgi:ubiquitin carboxyl-terminal hydrolase L5
MADRSAGDWCLIESDPGVFTELIAGFGVNGVQVEELWSLDAESFARLAPVHGLIFLFKWRPDDNLKDGSLVQDSRLDNIFFAKQVINNACATQAILSILLNCDHEDLELGKTLTDFKKFTQGFDPASRGLALSNSDLIRQVHNSFARQQMFEFDEHAAKKDDDVYHFVGYLPIGSRLYELDGLRDAPIDLGAVPAQGGPSAWLDLARPVIEKRMSKYSADEIHFNLMAVVSDARIALRRQLAGGSEVAAAARLEEEERKRAVWRLETVRRRHNYLPLIVELLRVLAEEGKLVDVTESARLRAEEKRQRKKEKKEAKAGAAS